MTQLVGTCGTCSIVCGTTNVMASQEEIVEEKSKSAGQRTKERTRKWVFVELEISFFGGGGGRSLRR